MIFYFSATGNSKYVAERVAKELCTCTVDIRIILVKVDLKGQA